jgi:hypothetical protein
LTAPIPERAFDDLIERLQDRQAQFMNTVRTGIDFNSITADKLIGYQSQIAQTRPNAGNLREMLLGLFTKDAADRYDEEVSNQILRMGAVPAREAYEGIRGAPSMAEWARGRGLLARGVRRRREIEEMRPRKLIDAITHGLYYPVAGAGAGEYGG